MDRLTGNMSAVNFTLGLFWHQPLALARREDPIEGVNSIKKNLKKTTHLHICLLGGKLEKIGSWSVFIANMETGSRFSNRLFYEYWCRASWLLHFAV